MPASLPRRTLRPGLALLAAALLSTGLHAQAQKAPDAKPRFIYTLTVTDKVRVDVFQEADLTTSTRVDASGNVNLPLLGNIHIAGLTVDQAQKVIEDAYVNQRYLRHPEVTISIDEYAPREVTIQGQVRNPSRYLLPLESTMSVVELVTKAGGFTDTAKGGSVIVTHYLPDGTKTVITVDVESIIKGKKSAKDSDNSLLLQPGDIVFVPERII
jgi:polysaccharide export outer membrane protein